MAEVTINNSPVHSQAIITYPYGVPDPNYQCGWHTGIDFAPYGETPAQPMLYSVVSGEVVQVTSDPTAALGIQVLILSSQNEYWRYCHMVQGSVQVSVGDLVTTASEIGQMGQTGNAQGIHLHLERATTFNWTCNTFLNPAEFLQIPNVDDTIVNYDGTIISKKNNWRYFKLKQRRIII